MSHVIVETYTEIYLLCICSSNVKIVLHFYLSTFNCILRALDTPLARLGAMLPTPWVGSKVEPPSQKIESIFSLDTGGS